MMLVGLISCQLSLVSFRFHVERRILLRVVHATRVRQCRCSLLISRWQLTAPFLVRLTLNVVSRWRTRSAKGFSSVGLRFKVNEGSAIACCHQPVDGPHVCEDLSNLAHLMILDVPEKDGCLWVEVLL